MISNVKNLYRYIEKKENYVAPVTTEVYNTVTGEMGTVQYVPMLKTIQILLKHEDVLDFVLEMKKSNDEYIYNYCDGSVFSDNELYNNYPHSLQIVLYHDDFTVVNPLGNKTVKYKMSAFYFQFANIPLKYRSQLTDIQLLMICPATMVKTFGYASILRPVIDDLKKLEQSGIEINIHDQSYKFFGTLTMVIADNLAAHALAGHYCNFSTVKRFCRFCLLTKQDIKNTHM